MPNTGKLAARITRNGLLIALFALIAMYALGVPQYTQLRLEIDRRYQAALWTKDAVMERAVEGNLSRLALPKYMKQEAVSVSTASGIITIAFPDLPAAAQGTLNLIPIVRYDGALYALADFLALKLALDPQMVFWACAAEPLRARDSVIVQNSGTLATELAPADCR